VSLVELGRDCGKVSA